MTTGVLRVEVLDRGATVRARLEGKLDAATVPLLLDAVEPLAVSAREVVLDCGDLELCDSSGLRGILVIRNTLGPSRPLRLTGARPGLRQILEITSLTGLLADDVAETEPDR